MSSSISQRPGSRSTHPSSRPVRTAVQSSTGMRASRWTSAPVGRVGVLSLGEDAGVDLGAQAEPPPAVAPVEPDAPEALVLRQLANGDLEDAGILVEAQRFDYNLRVNQSPAESRRSRSSRGRPLAASLLIVSQPRGRGASTVGAAARWRLALSSRRRCVRPPDPPESRSRSPISRPARRSSNGIPDARDDRLGHEADLVGRRHPLPGARLQVPDDVLAARRDPRRHPARLAAGRRRRRSRTSRAASTTTTSSPSSTSGPQGLRRPGIRQVAGDLILNASSSTRPIGTPTGRRSAIRAGTRPRSRRSPTTTTSSSCPSGAIASPALRRSCRSIRTPTSSRRCTARARSAPREGSASRSRGPRGSDIVTVSGTVPRRYFRWSTPLAIDDPAEVLRRRAEEPAQGGRHRAHGRRRRDDRSRPTTPGSSSRRPSRTSFRRSRSRTSAARASTRSRSSRRSRTRRRAAEAGTGRVSLTRSFLSRPGGRPLRASSFATARACRRPTGSRPASSSGS